MNILDSRDLEKRRQELQDMKDALDEARKMLADANAMPHRTKAEREERAKAIAEAEEQIESCEPVTDEEQEELEELDTMAEEVCEWNSGATLIRENYWVEYVEELCKDIGDVPQEIPGYIAIDWEKTAENIRADYSEVSYQGDTYYYRVC